jgi:hypothetical protein
MKTPGIRALTTTYMVRTGRNIKVARSRISWLGRYD